MRIHYVNDDDDDDDDSGGAHVDCDKVLMNKSKKV